jgi:hypothetical protein
MEKKILLHAPRKRVWRALAYSTEFGSWFGMKFDGPLVPGASIRGVIVPTKVKASNHQEMQSPKSGQVILRAYRRRARWQANCRRHAERAAAAGPRDLPGSLFNELRRSQSARNVAAVRAEILNNTRTFGELMG